MADAAVFYFLHVCYFQSRTHVETRLALTPFTASTQTVASVPFVRIFVIVINCVFLS